MRARYFAGYLSVRSCAEDICVRSSKIFIVCKDIYSVRWGIKGLDGRVRVSWCVCRGVCVCVCVLPLSFRGVVRTGYHEPALGWWQQV